MNRARHTWPLTAVCFVWLGSSTLVLAPHLAAQDTDTSSSREQLEDRLLAGELLEVSAGDLERAMTVYRTLSELPDAPESVRARALLYLARCHRKLGQVDRAKEYLDRLVQQHKEQRDVLRQARVFLRELQGERVNPEFDWLSELGRNPEIQARVFDLAMDLVDVDSESGRRARRQLLALGSVAVPVLEKMVATSRDTRHRHHLALLLINLGKVKHWSVLLDPKSPLPLRLPLTYRAGVPTSNGLIESGLVTFLDSIPTLPATERRRLLEVIDAVPATAETEPYRQLVRLHAGVLREFAPAIPALEKILHDGSSQLRVEKLFASRLSDDPTAPRALAARLLAPDCTEQDRYYELLLKRAPMALGVAHHRRMLELLIVRLERDKRFKPGGLRLPDESYPIIGRLEESGAFDALESFVAGPLGPNLIDYFWKTHIEGGSPPQAPAGWAPILRRARGKGHSYGLRFAAPDDPGGGLRTYVFNVDSGAQFLELVAETNDAFVGEFRDFLEHLDEEEPAYRGYGMRADWPWAGSPWRPSPRYLEAVSGLLEDAPVFARLVALEALSLIPLTNEQAERVEATAHRDEVDLVRETALYVLARQFETQPDYGPRLARALKAEAERRLDRGEDQVSSFTRRRGFGSIELSGDDSRRGRSRIRRGLVRSSSGLRTFATLRWPVRSVVMELYPHVVDLTTDDAGRRFHEWYLMQYVQDPSTTAPLLLAKALEFEDSERKAHALKFLGWSIERRAGELPAELDASQLLGFLKRIATDRGMPTDARLKAVQRGRKASLEWFDWPEFVRSDDPFVDVVLGNIPLLDYVLLQDASWQDAFWTAALESPHERARRYGYGSVPPQRVDLVEVLGRGLKDPAESVRDEVKDRILLRSTSDSMVPLILKLLADDESRTRLNAVKALQRLALQASVEPLVKALDDPNFEVRSAALEALKAIRATLEEKREWKTLLEQMKKK